MALSQGKQAAIGKTILALATTAEMEAMLAAESDNLTTMWISQIQAKIKKASAVGSSSNAVEGNGVTLSFSVPYGDGKTSGQLAFSSFKAEELVKGAEIDSWQRKGVDFIHAISQDGEIKPDFIDAEGEVVSIPCVLTIRISKSEANKELAVEEMGASLLASFGVK